jgi:membrane-associated phospholipid phosphatase
VLNSTKIRRSFYASLVFISFLLYPSLNKPTEAVHIIKLVIDDWIPLIPIFSIPYILYIPFLVITLLYFIFFTRLFKEISISFIFCQVIAAIVYAVYQTHVPRPSISEPDIFSKLVLFIYSKDQPYNCFPSLHVALSLISFLYWIKIFPNLKMPMGVFVVSIILSTMFVKQHYFLDVISGILLGIASFYIGNLSSLRKIGIGGKNAN